MQSCLLTPAVASSTTADITAAIISEQERPARPPNAWLEERRSGRRTPITAWQEWLAPNARAGVLSSRLTLDGLSPRTSDHVDLVLDGTRAATATVSTLPDRLPRVDEKPFVIMLGSCFCVAEDKIGRVGRRFASLPAELRPDLKLLSGDQVYLDSPFYHYFVPRTKQGLADAFLRRYRDTWTQSGEAIGFRRVLESGPALFTADDHEFWNNAPFPSFAVNTLTPGGRADWWELASGLFSTFQTTGPSAVARLDIGELSIFAADTRVHRSKDRTTVLDAPEAAELERWCAGLRAPGLLLVGQPLFAQKAGWTGRIADWNLPDFDQYGAICRALLLAPQPIIVVTGDVHYGRVAQARTPEGHEIVEIIGSPMSLVTGAGKRTWHVAPALFPDEAIPGVVQARITTLSTWQRAADHFLTIELWQEGARLAVRVRTWETSPDPDAPSEPVFEHFLQRRT
jgi:hypothetical protein